jgi:exosome complex component RRP4
MLMPGEIVAQKPMDVPDTFVEGGKTYASVLSTYDSDKGSFMPLEGLWYPRHGDMIIGIVDEARLNSYNIEINSLYKGIIIAKYADKLSAGDVIECAVKELDETRTAVLQYPRVLASGRVIDVKPSKVSRMIGKGSNMINMIAGRTGAEIKIGINGRVWIRGGNTVLATAAILMIEEEAHIPGLTDRISALLSEGNGHKGPDKV